MSVSMICFVCICRPITVGTLKGIRSKAFTDSDRLLQCETIDAGLQLCAALEDVPRQCLKPMFLEIDPNDTYQTLYELTDKRKKREVLTAEIVYDWRMTHCGNIRQRTGN